MLLTMLIKFFDRLAGFEEATPEKDERHRSFREHLVEHQPELYDWDSTGLFIVFPYRF